MSKLFYLIAVVFIVSCSSKGDTPATDKPKNTELKELKSEPVKADNKTFYTTEDSLADSKVSGYTTKLIDGKHNYGEYTRLTYSNTLQSLNAQREKGKKQMEKEEDISFNLQTIREQGAGGKIKLEIGRTTIGSANLDMFTILIKDDQEKELYRQALGSSIPETPNGDKLWWNIAIHSIPAKIRPPFYIYVVDKMYDKPFKFSVTPK